MGAYEDAVASVARRAARLPAIYAKDKATYDSVHANMPLGMLVAAVQWESDGKFDAPGSVSLGEVGYLQISAHTEVEYGVPQGTRTTPQGNLWLGAVDYAGEACRLMLRYPKVFPYVSKDVWLGARGVFSLGRSGFYRVMDAASPSSVEPIAQLARWAAAGGVQRSLPNGVSASQDAAKTAYRVRVLPLLWDVAVKSGLPMSFGHPALPPIPAGTPFQVPKDLVGRLKPVSSSPVVWLIAAAAAAWWWLKRKA